MYVFDFFFFSLLSRVPVKWPPHDFAITTKRPTTLPVACMFSHVWRALLSVAHTDDWARFARTLMEIRANRADGEEEGPMELAS
ncbi:hypothetical protein INR49_023619 [Caranx melampygus]|nr:hypothetical protein INR49_023619 [Caranx melampygus]